MGRLRGGSGQWRSVPNAEEFEAAEQPAPGSLGGPAGPPVLRGVVRSIDERPLRFAAPERSATFRRTQPLALGEPLLIRIKTADNISPHPRLWLMTQPGSAMAEQFRVLSLKLTEQRSVRVVGLTSPSSQEEAALAAANTALALGEGTRHRVLLIDTDLTHPQLGALMGTTQGAGLAEQLRAHRRQPGHPWEVLGLSGTIALLLAGAGGEKNPTALLSSEQLAELSREARRAFDYVVVCLPPVLTSADAILLQQHLDGVLLVVRAGVSRRDEVQAAIERLGPRRCLGVVLVEAK